MKFMSKHLVSIIFLYHIKSYIAHTFKFPFYIQKLKTDSECSATFVKLVWPSLIRDIFANRILLFLFYKPRNSLKIIEEKQKVLEHLKTTFN